VPQLGQNRPPGGTIVPQVEQVAPRAAPHPAQKRASSLFSYVQEGQVTAPDD
jgi:hypothetical protein